MQLHRGEWHEQGVRLYSIDLCHASLSASCLLEKLEHIFGEHGGCTIHLQRTMSFSGSTAMPDAVCC